MEKLEVIIVGRANTGKSALSKLIHDTLVDYDIDCEFIDQDGDVSHIDNWDDRIKSLSNKDTQITITQKQKNVLKYK